MSSAAAIPAPSIDRAIATMLDEYQGNDWMIDEYWPLNELHVRLMIKDVMARFKASSDIRLLLYWVPKHRMAHASHSQPLVFDPVAFSEEGDDACSSVAWESSQGQVVRPVQSDVRTIGDDLLGVSAGHLICGGQADFDAPWNHLSADDRVLLLRIPVVSTREEQVRLAELARHVSNIPLPKVSIEIVRSGESRGQLADLPVEVPTGIDLPTGLTQDGLTRLEILRLWPIASKPL